MITHGKPNNEHPGAYEHELRRFDGAVQTVASDTSDEEFGEFADSLIDEFRLSPLES